MYSFFTVRFYGEQMTTQVLESANRMSDVIKQSMHYSMLLNRKEDVYEIITTIGKEPGVEGIRIYNKRGEIMFSTDKNEISSVVNLHAEACYVCHEQEKPLESLPTANRTRIYEPTKGHRVLGLINPIRNEVSCSNADCHAHPPERTVLGVLDVRMSLDQLDAVVIRSQQTLLLVAGIAICLVVVIVAMFLSSTVVQPIHKLMNGVRQISSGNLAHRILITKNDELGTLARTFNEMASSLQQEKHNNERWAETLQERIREKTDELNAIHKQILHIEKMASLGKLSATVAHELNNPLEAILTYAKLIARRLRKDMHSMATSFQTLEDVELIARETERCGTIVKNLLLFSKKQVGEFAFVPLNEIIEKASVLVKHHCEISNVRLTIASEDASIVLMCDEYQIQQALIALFVNAVEAMPEGGTISVNVGQQKNEELVRIIISDTGMGIPQEDLPHIFEPFFTTKKDGRGVGLGLSIVYGIIERHGGRITVTSEAGCGTIFIITLPLVPSTTTSTRDIEHSLPAGVS
jgi:two-component system NtrC family sensor kinase